MVIMALRTFFAVWLFFGVTLIAGGQAMGVDLGGNGNDGADGLDAARALISEKSYAAAIPALQDAVAEDPTSADAWNLLGYALRHDARMEESGEAYEQALALDPDHLGALEYYGEWMLMQNDPAGATALLERLIALCPDGCEERAELAEAIADAAAGN